MQVQINPTFYQSSGGINFMGEDTRQINLDPLVTGLRLPIASPGAIEYAFQELVQPIRKEETVTGKEHFINEHKGFNLLLDTS